MNLPVSSSPSRSRESSGAVSAPRIRPDNAHAFGGIWRLSIRRFFNINRWLVLAGLLVLLVLFSFPAARTEQAAATGFLPWAARFYVCFLVPILAFLSSAGVVRDDLQASAVDYLFTRPVRRPVFLFFRYIAHVICTQFDFLLALAVVAAIGVYRHVPGLWAALPLLLSAQFLTILAFSAFGFLCAMITSRYVIIGLVYGALIEVGLGNVPTQLSHLSISRQTLSLLSSLLDGNGSGLPWATLPMSGATAVTLLLGTTLTMLGVSALIFAWREPAGALGRES